MCLVSVVIPFYSNTSGLLVRAVESVLAQDIKDLEIIVVDDCSPLLALDELKGVLDAQITVLRHEVNSNGGIARNTGIDAAIGEFIAFLDYDDIWYPDKLSEQIKLFKKVDGEGCEPVIYSRCKIIDGSRVFERPIRAINKNEKVGDYLFCARQIIQTSGIFLKAEVAKNVRFDDLKRHQDYQFCLALEVIGCRFFMLEKASYDFIQIPKLNDYNFSKEWMFEYSKYLSENAKNGFRKLVLLRSMVSSNHFMNAVRFAIKYKLRVELAKLLVVYLLKNIIRRFRYVN